jgi:GNAT superfamily N-acetyltransferase
MSRIVVRPVTAATYPDFVRLFEARGSPHYCWCTPYRFRDSQTLDSSGKKRRMHELVTERTPIGVIAYDGDEPIGWCSVAPRESYAKLERSKTMPRATPEGTPTWVILCFFVVRPQRGNGVTARLLQGAVAYAKAKGAKVVEGYPYDSAQVSATHRGHSKLFRSARFKRSGRRWARAL